ncbi:MAG: holo-ACP synthase [Lachnospiraceae bacterium]|nr:holo-ACP synthase [Lachnospiraceae bacterium]
MIIGIGTDIVEIQRIEDACKRESFYRLCYTGQEQKLCGNSPALAAGNFAVKEAVSKVFGTGFRKLTLSEIEVLRDSLGKPYVNLYGAAASLAKELGIERIHVSISDTKETVVAMAVGEGGER